MISLIGFQQGCNGRVGCFGPTGDTYTFLSAPTNALLLPFLIAVALGALCFWALSHTALTSRTALKVMCALIVAGIVFCIGAFIVGTLFASRVY